MKLARPTFVSVAALFFALSLTAAQAGAQNDGMSQGGGAPAAGNLGAGEGGQAAGAAGNASGARPDQPGSSAGQSGAMSGGPDGAPPKGSAAGSPSATDAGKESKGMAEGQTDTPGYGKDGTPSDRKSGSAAENQPDKRDGMSEDRKSGATAEDKGDAARDGMAEDKKSGATAEGKSDPRDKAGKSARLESKDVSKVRSHFSQNRPSAKRIDKDDVSVSIGIALPSAVVLYDLPPDVIMVAGPCPIQYFVWDDDVVLVDSCTREVVEIIADAA
jgi:hypothetical protein